MWKQFTTQPKHFYAVFPFQSIMVNTSVSFVIFFLVALLFPVLSQCVNHFARCKDWWFLRTQYSIKTAKSELNLFVFTILDLLLSIY